MAKPAKNKKPNVRAEKQGLLRDGPNWPLFILALIGMGLTAYLTFTAWQGKTGGRLHGGQRLRRCLE